MRRALCVRGDRQRAGGSWQLAANTMKIAKRQALSAERWADGRTGGSEEQLAGGSRQQAANKNGWRRAYR